MEIKKNNFSPFSRTNSTLRKVFVKKTYSNEKFVSHWCNKKAAATPPQGQIKAKNGGFYIRRHVISLIMLCQNW